jgi:hypothetical protein
MRVNKKLNKPKPSIVYDTYWKFAAERQAIFFNRIENKSIEWTSDPVLKKFKFTNAYRASDRVSQYLISEVIYSRKRSNEDIFFRILLFKLFNKIDTWEFLSKEFGEISCSNYSFEKYSSKLQEKMNNGESIYSGAYIMTSGKSYFGYERKHQNHLRLIEMMMKENVPQKIVESTSLEEVFNIFKSYPLFGNFLSYQLAIDINYSELTSFSEMDFVVPGPGAIDGIKKCFTDLGDYSEVDIIKMMCDNQEEEFERLGLKFQTLWGRPLQLIDCQNLFCEVDKYARVMHPEISSVTNRTRIKQLFKPIEPKIQYKYPPKWKIELPILHPDYL